MDKTDRSCRKRWIGPVVLLVLVVGLPVLIVAGRAVNARLKRARTAVARRSAEQMAQEARKLADALVPPAGWTREARTVEVALPGGERSGEIIYFRNPAGMEFVAVPAGEFTMGIKGGHGASWGPAHRVRITRPFLMGAHEVTRAQYEAVTGTLNYSYYGDPPVRGKAGGRYPAGGLKWEQADAFCRQLAETDGLPYRLPTEAEWEYAYRAGTTTRHYLGNRDPKGFMCIYYTTEGGPRNPVWRMHTEPVGSFPASALGLFDMGGNVWEWCSDWYAEDYYTESPTDDPQGPATGTVHAMRGGSWFSGRVPTRSAFRAPGEARATGLRVVLSADKLIRADP